MVSGPAIGAAPPTVGLLRGLESRLAQLGRQEIGEALSPVLARLQERLPPAEAQATMNEVLAVCRRLYENARSADAVPLAKALLAQARRANDRVMMRRAAGTCGLLLSDSGDVAGAIEHQVLALRIASAADEPIEVGRVWHNIGLAFGISGSYDLGVRCYLRALATIAPGGESDFGRYAMCSNLSNGYYHLGEVNRGLEYGERALREQTPAFVAQDCQSAILLRRNLVRLLIATGQVQKAEAHIEEIAALVERTHTPRALIAAATTRAAYELAIGRTDLALTRIDQALASARSIPAVLRDTLACAIRAEEAAGNAERALARLQELSDHLYRFAVERAREHVEIANLPEAGVVRSDLLQEQVRARLVSRLHPPEAPPEWQALQRLAVGAVLRKDKTGWHGVRVGALTKALALAWGCAPLQALEFGLAAELHDLGMLSVPEAILSKPGELNDAERALMRRHTEAGAEILRDDRHPRILTAREIAGYHHARWDGAGYPERVGGKFIPLAARMCAIADAYDEMVCGGGYRENRTMGEALEELRRTAGSQFDPDLVRCFDALVRGEAQNLGIDPSSNRGLEGFQALVHSLLEDRGFI